MNHKSKHFASLNQQDLTDVAFLSKECRLDSIENLDAFKQNPRLLLRLKMVLENDNIYEAHQLYKTVNFRCTTLNLLSDCVELLYNGIVYFASKNALPEIVDLAKVFVETLKKSQHLYKAIDDELRRKIKVIHAVLKSGVEERNEFTVSVLKWSSNLFTKPNSPMNINDQESVFLHYQKTFGSFELHREFALNFWLEKNYVQARYHFLHSLDACSFAHMIIECHLNFGLPSEYDLFLAQAILQLLSLRMTECAHEFFNAYTKNHPKIFTKCLPNSRVFYFESPLINFIGFLLETIKKGDSRAFKALLELYAPSLQRDNSLLNYVDRIGEYYFNIRKSKPRSDNLLGNLMRMLTGGASNETTGQPASNLASFGQSDDDHDSVHAHARHDNRSSGQTRTVKEDDTLD